MANKSVVEIERDLYVERCVLLENELKQWKLQYEAAVADIPHVGMTCAYMRERKGAALGGYCEVTGAVCCRKVHTPCERWKWRGEGG